MRLRVVIPTLALTAILFVLPYTAFAQTIPFFGPIVPDAINRCPASFALFMDVVNRIILFSITIAIVFVAPLMIAWAGFLLVVNPFNAGAKEQAKKILLNTVVGIVIALAGWLIVAALMAVLYKPDLAAQGKGFVANWAAIVTGSGDPCLIQAGALQKLNQVEVTGSTAEDGLTTTPGPGQLKNGFAVGCSVSNDQNVSTLVFSGVAGRSTNNCCVKTQSTCTSLDGMLPNTIQQIINIQEKCGGVIVTGGTETGHSASHSGGAKMDITSGSIDSCIQSSTTPVVPPSFGIRQQKDAWGNIYTLEAIPSHWDILVKQAGVL